MAYFASYLTCQVRARIALRTPTRIITRKVINIIWNYGVFLWVLVVFRRKKGLFGVIFWSRGEGLKMRDLGWEGLNNLINN